ncbi:MAG: CHAT domain-containing protein [Bacteroidota bacterium]
MSYRNNSYPITARKFLTTAQLYQLLKRPKDALDYFQKGLQTLSPGYKLPSQLDNPPIDQVLAQPVALQLLKGKANLLQQLADQKQDKQLRQTAYQTYLLATELIRQMRLGVQTADAKNALSSQSVGIYEGAIQTALQLHQDDPNPDYLRQAFRLAESNKALLLLESLNARQASGFANLPDSLREAEAALRIDLAYYQKQILEARQQKAKIDSARLRSQEQQLFKLQQEYEQLSQQMERNYPQYYQLKYQHQPIQIDQLQEQLAEQQSSLLEYFAGDSALYLFVLSPQELQVIHIQDQESIYQDVQYLRQFISRSPAAGLSADELKNYAQKAHRLYQQLIAPAQVHLPEDTKRLLIVPDYTLAYLPFELLLQQDPGPTPSSFSPDKLDYLLKNYLISNDYSAALWSRGQQKSRQEFSDSFVGFAPSFASTVQAEVRSCNENQLSSLQCNQEEIQQIQSLIGGRQYLAEAASKQQFGQQIEGSEVLHLATHACVDEDSPMLSKIFLSDDYLSIFDLYNIRLQSELVVLSACNTGSGKLIKGEGVLSLARGFITAGCASTVMSLWSVDDCATSEIMAAFYRQLKEGKPKDAALQEAKLDFLAGSSKAKQHPFYWAAFVQYGNNRPLGHSQGGLNWLVLAGLLLMGLSLGILVTNLRKKNAQRPT